MPTVVVAGAARLARTVPGKAAAVVASEAHMLEQVVVVLMGDHLQRVAQPKTPRVRPVALTRPALVEALGSQAQVLRAALVATEVVAEVGLAKTAQFSASAEMEAPSNIGMLHMVPAAVLVLEGLDLHRK